MRVTYIAPRYHTNQIAVVNGWYAHGDSVQFIVRAQGPIEDHSNIVPVMVPYAPSFELLRKIYVRLHRNDPYAQDIALRYGYPSFQAIRQMFDAERPDLVILRERSIYSIVCYRICRRLGIRTLLYNQSPLWEEPDHIHKDLPHRLMDRLLPIPRFTPVRTRDNTMDGKVMTENSYFVPFIIEPQCAPEQREYLRDHQIQILEVGRFERRKNHLLMLQAFYAVHRQVPETRLIIVGEVSDSFHEEYLEEVRAYIAAHDLQESVRILTNCDHAQMRELYLSSDLFVLPSTGEPAAISPLEAMSYSLPAISSTGNGTADYIQDGVTGHIFADNNAESLTDAILDIVSDPSRIVAMGRAAYQHIKDNYGFANYYDAVMQIPENQS